MQTARSKPLIELRPYQHAAMEAITQRFRNASPELASFKEASDFLNTRFTPKTTHP